MRRRGSGQCSPRLGSDCSAREPFTVRLPAVTIGKQNADLQITRLNNNAQPFYVLVGKDERVLAWPYGYDKDVEDFVEFLETGKKTYRELYLN